MSADDVHLTPSSPQIPLASNYGQVLLLVLHGLPMHNKIKLLKHLPEQDSNLPVASPVTLLPSGGALTLPELVMVTASYEIADELFSYSGSAERMQELARSIDEDAQAFVGNGKVILQGLKLIKKKIKKRKKKVVNASLSLAADEIKSPTLDIKRILKGAGVKKSKSVLIPLEHLLFRDHVHRSHQHWMEDDQERWNLAGE